VSEKKIRRAVSKRVAEVPPEARLVGEMVSKADLLEAAWHLANLVGDDDDEASTLDRLVQELNIHRAHRRKAPLKKPEGSTP
jgi:dephospho-CoA kinase